MPRPPVKSKHWRALSAGFGTTSASLERKKTPNVAAGLPEGLRGVFGWYFAFCFRRELHLRAFFVCDLVCNLMYTSLHVVLVSVRCGESGEIDSSLGFEDIVSNFGGKVAKRWGGGITHVVFKV